MADVHAERGVLDGRGAAGERGRAKSAESATLSDLSCFISGCTANAASDCDGNRTYDVMYESKLMFLHSAKCQTRRAAPSGCRGVRYQGWRHPSVLVMQGGARGSVLVGLGLGAVHLPHTQGARFEVDR